MFRQVLVGNKTKKLAVFVGWVTRSRFSTSNNSETRPMQLFDATGQRLPVEDLLTSPIQPLKAHRFEAEDVEAIQDDLTSLGLSTSNVSMYLGRLHTGRYFEGFQSYRIL